MPFDIDVSTPQDNMLISAFPANERNLRQTVQDLIVAEHYESPGNGTHKVPRGTTAARPVSPLVGNIYYDTTLGQMIICLSAGVWTAPPVPVSFIVGEVRVFAFLPSLYPFGWYACNWQELDRIAHGALFSKLGLSYGPGNGSTTFNVPDLRARVPVSANMVATGNPAALSADGDGEYGSFGTVYGVKKAALTMAQMPSHDHPGSVTGFSTLPDPIPYGAEPGGFLFDAGSASFYANTSHYHNVTIALQGGATVVDRRNPEMVFTFGIYSGV